MKIKIPSILIILMLVCAAGAGPNLQAVVPPPDGGYPGGTTAEGQNALFSLTTGGFNTGLGFLSLRSNTTASFNTAVGAGTLLANTGANNTATGAGALLSNTSGFNNTAGGTLALFSNTEGDSNTAYGLATLFANTTGAQNTAVGLSALTHNTEGGGNTAVGLIALSNNTTGSANTAVGSNALGNNDGNQNTAVGAFALGNNVNASNNIALGSSAGTGITTADNVICIGTAGQNVANSCYIGQIFGVTSSGGTGVFINADGKLGTATSSLRFKEQITPMDSTSEVLFALKPVTFRYKKEIDPAGLSQFGLVAEEVEKVNPDLVVRDKDGKPYSVRYDQVNAMLLNEFLKEHRTLQEQGATIAELKNAITSLTAIVKEQAAQIQKVNARVAMREVVSQLVVAEQ
jgi:hypothetical protein